MKGLLLQLMNARTMSMLQIWGEIKDFSIGDIDDNDFMNILARLAVPVEKQGLCLQSFQELRKLLLAADIDTWADSITDEGLLKFFAILTSVLSRSSVDPSDVVIDAETGLLCEHFVGNNNNNKENNNNNHDDLDRRLEQGDNRWSV